MTLEPSSQSETTEPSASPSPTLPPTLPPTDGLPTQITSQPSEIERRLRNVETIVGMVRHISDKAGESFDHYLAQKAQSEQKAHDSADRHHRRSSWTLIYSISLIFVLALAALLKGQYELVKLILGSSLAIAAGVGLASLWQKGQRKGE